MLDTNMEMGIQKYGNENTVIWKFVYLQIGKYLQKNTDIENKVQYNYENV